MKTSVPFKQNILKTILFVFATTSAILVNAQEFQFKNSSKESGTTGADNCVYRFPDIDATHDALVTIKGRSSASVTLTTMDLTSSGFTKAFQPEVEYNNGSVSSASSWWMEFEVKFVNANTSTAVTLPTIFVTGLDIDGDDGNLREFNTFYSSNYYIQENNANLTVSSVTGTIAQPLAAGKKFTGTTVDHSGIDTSAKTLMSTNVYLNVSTITFRVGATTTGSSSNTERMHAVYFRNFTYSSPMSTLPVKLTSFTATLGNNNKTDLRWSTASEINVNHFVIEKSTDGINFNDAGVVFAYGNSTDKTNYSFSDNLNTIQSGTVYYRLRSVDIDGKSQYSEIRIIRISKESKNTIAILTYPNPVANELRISIPGNWQNKKVIYEVFNANGQVSKKTEAASSSQTETVNMSNLTPGLYIVRVSCGGEVAEQKVVKQ